MKICQVRQLTIGEGKPKICVPVVETITEKIIQQIQELQNCDLIELRIDFYENIHDLKQVHELLLQVRQQTNLPLLLTYRSLKEGGHIQLSDQEYLSLVQTACQSGCIDIVDIELESGNMLVYQLVEIAHQNHVKVLMSYHDFEKTPAVLEIKERLEKMEIMGADICKIAVMPFSYKDVIQLLNTTMEMSQRLTRPLVTMSMGKIGKITRIVGELVGSSITFASVGQSSAPGQLTLEDMQTLLEVIHHD
ncbi:type I 3-dehydroquinate dehydratase [Massilimicrobiota timonensis]|uniref:type I 3-dehydroquinate dehydratase n=1 Tax=Massilimicrobiota timonensis TaxID=1776392 RepID=UPI001961FB19|nr:type I 3-dehydroquinate dehydratase [Massilimicrobiota timonensis]MBM6967008.1 type I 3-dehydroquinate dehydratase [Massilimicrobiota timonensis]